MTSPIENILTETRNAKWIYQEFTNNNLYIDRSFQRRLVWLPKDKARLIETMLLGYTIPELYFSETETDPETGITKYSVVDGQQRIDAVNDFINNQYSLNGTYIDYKNELYKDKKFEDLPDDYKKKIWNYPFSVRFIKEKIQKDEIVIMFDRLNSTSYALSPQELRHARFNGLFHGLSLEIAQNEFWDDNCFFTGNQGRRMIDVEFASQILMFFRFGIEEEIGQANINKAYKLYDQEYAEYEDDKNLFLHLIGKLQELITYSGEDKSVLRFLKRTTHLYSILVLLYYINDKYNELSEDLKERIIHFIKAYEEDQYTCLFYNLNQNEIDLIDEYKNISVEGTKSKSSRMGRIKVLKKFLKI